MWLFWILLFIIIVASLVFSCKKRTGRKYYCILIFSVLIFLAMFRSSEVGNDTRAYTNLYDAIASGVEMQTFTERYEKGIIYLCKILSYITIDNQFLIVVYGAFVFYTAGYFIYKLSIIPWISTLMFFCLYFDDTLSAMRQGLALALILISFFYINRKRITLWLCLNIIAILFHNAAIVFLIAYPLSIMNRYGYKWKVMACLATGGFIVFSERIMSIALKFFPKYQYYIGSTYFDGEMRIGTLALLVIVGGFFVFSYCVDRKYRYTIECFVAQNGSFLSERGYNLISNLGFLSCLITICAFRSIILERFVDITSIFLIIYYPNMLARVHSNSARKVCNMFFMTMIIIYRIAILIYRPVWGSTYPYSFWWAQ